MATIETYVEVDIDLSEHLDELSADDVISWLDYHADKDDIRQVKEYIDADNHDSVFIRLCREIDNHGVESFLNLFIHEVTRANLPEAHLIRMTINDYLEKRGK